MSSINDAYKKGTPELKGLSPSMATRPTFLDGAKTAGLRDYELTDHLSNVMAVISDRKLSVDTNNDNITDYYAPQVVSFTDYYPFGFPMAERSGNLAGYRFGFNGQEGDGEIYGAKQSYTAEFWQYDTRLGRRWNVDPMVKPWESSYAAFANNPIWFIDPFGADSIQRAAAIAKAEEYVKENKNPSHSSYKMGAKGGPGSPTDCSGLVSNCVIEGGEANPNEAVPNGQRTASGWQSGVLNIEDNTKKVDIKDVQPGNLITWRIQGAEYPYHVGIVTDVSVNEEGKTVIEFIHSSGNKGPNKRSFTVGDNSYYERQVHGYYKWDTKPDVQISNDQDVQKRINYTPADKIQYIESLKVSYKVNISIFY